MKRDFKRLPKDGYSTITHLARVYQTSYTEKKQRPWVFAAGILGLLYFVFCYNSRGDAANILLTILAGLALFFGSIAGMSLWREGNHESGMMKMVQVSLKELGLELSDDGTKICYINEDGSRTFPLDPFDIDSYE